MLLVWEFGLVRVQISGVWISGVWISGVWISEGQL